MEVLAFLDKLQHIAEPLMRSALMREAITERSPAFGVAMLGTLVERCLLGAPPGEDALMALVPVLLDVVHDGELYLAVRDIYELAAIQRAPGPAAEERQRPDEDAADEPLFGAEVAIEPDPAGPHAAVMTHEPTQSANLHAVVCNLLLDPPPFRTPPKRQFKFGPRWERDVTLGQRKAFAVGGNRVYLERLIYDAEPAVIEKLCSNPRITEQDIMLIVTRRPVQPSLLLTVARSRWLARYGVRRGMVLNPFNSTGLTLRLVPLLHSHDLRALVFIEDLHPVVRDTAQRLVSLREHLGSHPTA